MQDHHMFMHGMFVQDLCVLERDDSSSGRSADKKTRGVCSAGGRAKSVS